MSQVENGTVLVRIDRRHDPLGVEGAPVASWTRPPDAAPQCAWRVVMSSRGRELWDSGRVEGGELMTARASVAAVPALATCSVAVESWSADGCDRGEGTLVRGVPADDPLWDSARWITGS